MTKIRFDLEEIADYIETWLISDKLNTDILADNFQFNSPFWQGSNKEQFLDKFLDPTVYIDTSLSNIVKFDPIIKFKSISDNKHFAIILQYHTKNGSNIYEAVMGTVVDRLLVDLRSIYDLNATKQAHGLI